MDSEKEKMIKDIEKKLQSKVCGSEGSSGELPAKIYTGRFKSQKSYDIRVEEYGA